MIKKNWKVLVFVISAVLFLTADAAVLAMGNKPRQEVKNNSVTVSSDLLFYDLAFDYNCCNEERQLIWKIKNLEKDRAVEKKALGGETGIRVGIIRYDLNDDGKEDLLVRVDSSINCGSHGCAFYIFIQGDNNKYKEMRDPFVTYTKVGIGHQKTNGFHDLFFLGRNKKERSIWKWNGTKYNFASSFKE